MPTPEEYAAARKLLSWKRDPVQQSIDDFGYTPDKWQVQALRDFATPYTVEPKYQRIGLQACVGPGKTFVEAVCAWNFLSCYSDGKEFPNGAAVSITGENLRANLWKEMAMLRDRSPFLRAAFEMTSERIFERQHPKTWFLEARSFSKSANSDAQGRTLSGLHSPYICYFLDEVGDMAPSVLRAAEQGLSNCRWGKIVAAGNASSHLGILYEIVKNQPHLWTIIRVTGDPDDPNRSSRISETWARQMIDKYGRDNPWVMYAILGLFPPTSVNALLGPDEVAAAMGRHVTVDQYEFIQKRIGIDVARFGDDKTVLFPRQGLASFTPVEMRNARTEAIAGRLIAGKAKWGSEAEFIDDTGGYGAGVIDACRLGGVHLIPVNFSGKADDPRYFNKRAEMHWRMAEWVKNGGCLPNIPELARELVAATYFYDKGKLRITEKDQIKAELQGHSPDCFVAGTMVSTPNGPVAIETLGAGDEVCTPVGTRRVIHRWESVTDNLTTAKFSNGAALVGKGKHKIFTWDAGFVRLDALSLTNEIESNSLGRRLLWRIRRNWFTKASPIGFRTLVDTISPVGRMTRSDFFTVASGVTRTVQFPQTALSTIGTAIGRIIGWRTWNVCLAQSTNGSIWLNDSLILSSGPNCLNTPLSLDHSRKYGTRAPRAWTGTESTERNAGKGENLSRPLVQSVEMDTRHISRRGLDSVPAPARNVKGISATRRRLADAWNAVRNFATTSIASSPVVPVSVATVAVSDCRVYNLTLDRDNVYYANGILVANCADSLALTFALVDLPSKTSPEMMLQQFGQTQANSSDFDPWRELNQ